jgi:hypothetical protein
MSQEAGQAPSPERHEFDTLANADSPLGRLQLEFGCGRVPLTVGRQLSWASGNRMLGSAIAVMILLNAALAYAQALRAARATEALKELLPPHACYAATTLSSGFPRRCWC